MSLPIYQRVAVTDTGDVIPGAEYTVINENTGVAAPIYSDRTGATLLSAPYFADSAGTIQFFIAQGTTFRVAASGGVGTYTDRYVYGVAEAVLVQPDGKVGIGTSSPVDNLNIYDSNNNVGLHLQTATTGTTGNDGFRVGLNNSYGFLWQFESLPIAFGTSGAERMRIDANGAVGVNYSNPSLLGTLVVGQTVDGKGIAIADSTKTNTFFLENDGTQCNIRNNDAVPIVFSTNLAERMRITSAGELVVGGTTAIGSSSTIYQAGDSRNATTFVSSAPTQPYGLQVRYTVANPNSTVNGFFEAYAWNGSSYLQKFVVRSNGGIANFQANDVNLSDESEKKNITDPGSTWSCLKEWDVIQYHYNFDADDSDKKYGVIAQQVEAYCPEVISDFKTQEKIDEVLWVDDDELPEGVSVGDVKTAAQDEVIRKGVKEQQMMWMAIKALQEAQARIESLEKRITTLEAK